MVKGAKKILAMAMMWGLLGTSILGAGADSHVYAATRGLILTGTEKKTSSAGDKKITYRTEKTFPVGTALGSDKYEGLRVTYNDRETYTVKKGEQTVTIAVTVLDETKAKAGIDQLILAFGKVEIVNKKKETTVFVCRITGVEQSKTASSEAPSQQKPSSDPAPADEGGSSSDADEIRGRGFSPEYRPDEKENKSIRTVIMYLVGSDIESDNGYMSKQLLDMLESGIPKSTRFILVTGGSESWHMDDIECYKEYATETLFPGRASYDECTDEEKARIDADAKRMFEKYSTEISGVQIWEIESSNRGNSLKLLRTVDNEFLANPDFITTSIDFATEYAPALNYDLIFSGHGNGMYGFGYDDLYDAWSSEHPGEEPVYESLIPIRSIAKAIEDSGYIKNGGKFELLGFDSCLMGGIEVASSLSKYAKYFVASEENSHDKGWRFSGLINAVREDLFITGEDLSKVLTDSYAELYDGTDYTLSGVDLKQMERLDEALTRFSSLLNSEADENYYHIIRSLGGDSDFDIKYSASASNLYDLKRIATVFSEDEGFSVELREASRDLVNALSDAVIANFGGIDEAGGLSIYFPRHAVASTNTYFWFKALDHIELYEANGFNETYTDMVKKLASRDLFGLRVGRRFWKNENDISTEDFFNDLYSIPELQSFIEIIDPDRNDPEDPYVRIAQQVIDDRIHTGKIKVTVPERIYDDGEHWHYAEPADVHVGSTDSEITGDRLLVGITLGDIGTSLGSTVALSDEKTSGPEEDGKEYLDLAVSAFDQKWYTLNGQITSMYITEVKEDLSGFYGHIPLLKWNTAEYAAGTDEDNQDRSKYIADAASEDKFIIIWLNVEGSFSTDADGNLQQDLTAVNGEVVDQYYIDSERYLDLEELSNKYYEILGGAEGSDELIFEPDVSSLGTVYIDSEGTIDIETAYVDNLSATYYFTDIYGKDYSMTNENLGEDEAGNPRGMDDFYQPIPADVPEEEIVTWEESQLLAQQIWEQAAQEAENEDQPAYSGEALQEVVIY